MGRGTWARDHVINDARMMSSILGARWKTQRKDPDYSHKCYLILDLLRVRPWPVPSVATLLRGLPGVCVGFAVP